MSALWAKIKSAVNSIGPILAAIFLVLFYVEKKRGDSAEEKLMNADTKAKDDALKAQGDALQSDSTKTEAAAEQEKAIPQTPQEMVDFLNETPPNTNSKS